MASLPLTRERMCDTCAHTQLHIWPVAYSGAEVKCISRFLFHSKVGHEVGRMRPFMGEALDIGAKPVVPLTQLHNFQFCARLVGAADMRGLEAVDIDPHFTVTIFGRD